MDKQPQLVAPQDSSLYNTMKRIVWVIRLTFSGDDDRGDCHIYRTGFCLSTDGLILTSAELLTLSGHRKKISARRVDDEGFRFEAEIVHQNESYGLVLMKVREIGCYDWGVLAPNGNGALHAGNRVFLIGHPLNYGHMPYSFYDAYVAYPCCDAENVTLSKGTCKDDKYFEHSDLSNYRTAKEVYNKNTLQTPIPLADFGKMLNPMVPIIQLSGCVLDDISYFGAPVIKSDGEIVGMLAFYDKGFGWAIHVSLIRCFVEEFLKRGDN